ncbi:hypothetical protein D0Z07_5026 [Hyphodiscus hymeniophilus]|uniref:Alpha-L-rhamnosidase six-hairpin glycosidase domain-containing protein n=1 Tax=Hyphodiscus hymeniophilus TaxID=353542 RepID=A0A9P6VJB6_9HELO|nr:hypothetical protein D0Z07_5026 [Hyphodiscus hymeniophilus]
MYFIRLACLGILFTHSKASYPGPDYEKLPFNTIFPGPWDSNIRAPSNKSQILPVKIFNFEGAVSGAEAVLQDAERASGVSWLISPGGLITFEFAENIGGRVCFEVDDLKNDPFLILSYSESPFFAGRECDATGDRQARDLPLSFSIKRTGVNCVAPGYIRGAFKYLTVYMSTDDTPTEGGYWHDGHSAPQIQVVKSPPWYSRIGQKFLGSKSLKNETGEPAVSISAVWVNCTAFPSQPNGRAYTGYFDSSSSLLNRIWYSGAWTLQLSTLNPNEGGSLIDFNRNFDHNNAPQGAWYSNYTVASGTAVTTDGAKRDRMVWPGDMTIAVPGIAVSTYDMLAIRNALDVIYNNQYGDGSMPYAGPPMGAFGEFSDTYHLHTLIGTYYYVLYSGDLDWLIGRWAAYTRALGVSIGKVDEFNLLHVSSGSDWNRWGMTGHNVEASAILYEVLKNSIQLALWIDKNETSTRGEAWSATRERLQNGISTLYCPANGMYSDNKGRRSCTGPEKVLPQDGNSWVLMSRAFTSQDHANHVSSNLRQRWNKFGAPAVEFPNVMSPFASSFELLGHLGAGNPDAAVELMELMWGYMLDGPGMTNSTTIEGYRVDGYVHYPAYWAAARNSHAHGWSSGPTAALMQGVLGIELTSPLGATWKIEPKLTKWLSYAKGGFATRLGKFEVAVELMKSLRTGRRAEMINVAVPSNTSGTILWGEEAVFVTKVHTSTIGARHRFWRFVDSETATETEGEGSDQVNIWTSDMEGEWIRDEEWVKPRVEERLAGVVDWDLLEEGYLLAGQKFIGPLPPP